MSKHLANDLTSLKKNVLAMGGLVEQSLECAARALAERDEDLARSAIAADREIDRMELLIDDECLKLLALHQPVASDLRFVTATIRITNDLERIGDLAGNLGERALFLRNRRPLDAALGFEEMLDCSTGMLRSSLDSLVHGDADLARDVVARDDVVDAIHIRHFDVLQQRMKADPDSVETAVAWLSVSRNVERVADLATNIAEDVVFTLEAVDIRHPRLHSRGPGSS